MGATVLCAMSGGVDSSVCAFLLKKAGFDVIGVTMKLSEYQSYGKKKVCCDLQDIIDASKVCKRLGIPHYVLNLVDEFKKSIVENFVQEYLKGRTPNPCIRCNYIMKFDVLLKKGEELGADFIATGHYARIENNNGRLCLKKGVDKKKDQSYFLYRLTKFQLKKILFPLGNLTKPEVRKIAMENDIPIFDKPESQEICFVPDNNYKKFIKNSVSNPEKYAGNIVDISGKVLKKHGGIFNFTIGQRKGLGISMGKPYYVVKIDALKNEVVVGEEKYVFSSSLVFSDVIFLREKSLISEDRVYFAKIRYRTPETPCKVKILNNNTVKVSFLSPVRAITPGQACVVYDGDEVIMGGVIERAE